MNRQVKLKKRMGVGGGIYLAKTQKACHFQGQKSFFALVGILS